ncbi:MAG: ROK family protein [Phycisphaerae bacterium]
MKSRKRSEKLVLSYLAMRIQAPLPALVQYVGMPASTVMGILSRLAQVGLVTKSGTLAGVRGRPMAIYKLQLPKPVAACQFDGTQLVAGLLGTDLQIRCLEKMDLDRVETAVEAAKLVDQILSRVESASGVNRGELEGLALSINAVKTKGRILMSSVLPWVNETAQDVFSSELNVPVRLVHLPGVVAEYQKFTCQAPRSLVLFNVGDGISTHAIFSGRLFRGHSRLAGELGHIIADPAGPLCGCGRRGCLEAYCSGPAIYKHVLEELDSGVMCSLDRSRLAACSPRQAMEEIGRAWCSGDSYIRAFMEQILERLGWGLGLVMNLMDPEYVALGGYVLKDRPEWVEELIRRIPRWTLHAAGRRTKFEISRVSTEDELRGIGAGYYYAAGATKAIPDFQTVENGD